MASGLQCTALGVSAAAGASGDPDGIAGVDLLGAHGPELRAQAATLA